MIHITDRFHLISMLRGSDRIQTALEGREELGGKAQGLLSMHQTLAEFNAGDFPDITVDIPELTVLGTSVFDAFMERNGLHATAFSDLKDERLANAFQRASLPFESCPLLHTHGAGRPKDQYTGPT